MSRLVVGENEQLLIILGILIYTEVSQMAPVETKKMSC